MTDRRGIGDERFEGLNKSPNGVVIGLVQLKLPVIAIRAEATAKTGRNVGAHALFTVIADETDEAAQAKWECYKDGKDLDALSWMGD